MATPRVKSALGVPCALVVAAVVGLRAHQRLRVGAGQLAQPRGEVGQLSARLHAVQQRLRAVRTGGDDDPAGLEHPPFAPAPLVRGQGGDGVPAPRVVGDGHDGRHRVHDRARLLGQVEIVLVEGVLRAVPAAGHALAALGAGLAGGSGAAEVGVRHLAAGPGLRRAVRVLPVAEEDAHRRHVEGVADAHPLGGRLEMDVGRGHGRVEPHAEHPSGLVVVRLQLPLPVGDVLPLRVVEERLRRYVEGVGVVQGAAADSGARQHHDVAQQMDALDAVHAERRRPQIVLDVPGVLGQRVAGEAAARFQHSDAVALFGEPQGRDRPAEAGADDDDVVVVRVAHRRLGSLLL